jgi:hypothetical protein
MQFIVSCLERHNSERERGFVVVKMNNSNSLVLGHPTTCQLAGDDGE